MERMEPVLAVKVALVAFAGTVTEAGMVSTLAIPPESVTTTPPEGAAAIRVTVQVVLPLDATVEAAH